MDQLSRRDFLQKSTAMALAAGTITVASASSAQAQDTTATSEDGSQPKGKFELKTAIKTSILKKVAGDDSTWEQKLSLAKECGYQGVEWDDITTPEEGAKIQEMAQQMGVPFHGVVFGGWHAPLSDPAPAVTQKGIDGMKNAISAANAMGVKTCLLVPAVVRPEVSYDDAYKRSQDNVRELIPHAQQNDVVICLENVWNKFLLSPMEFARYIDELDSPHVGMYFDFANSLVQGFSEHWMRILGKRIRKCDVKDFSRKENRFVPVGDGDANFREIKKILEEWGYNDYLTAESNVGNKEELTDARVRMERVFK